MIGPQCDDEVSIAQMIMRTLGAEYEHKRNVRDKYLNLLDSDEDLVARNCLYKNQGTLCDECEKISTTVDELEWKEHGAPYDLNSIMQLSSGICASNMESSNKNFITEKDSSIIAQNTQLSAEDIIGLNNLYCPAYNLYNFCDGYNPLDIFQGNLNTIRYPLSYRCDGTVHCFDGSDETHCKCLTTYCAGASQVCALSGECECKNNFQQGGEAAQHEDDNSCYPDYDAACPEGLCDFTQKCEIKSNTETCVSILQCGSKQEWTNAKPNNLEYSFQTILTANMGEVAATCATHVEINSQVYNRTTQIINNHPVYEHFQNSEVFSRYICFRGDIGWVQTSRLINNCDISCGIEWYYPVDVACIESSSNIRIMTWDIIHSLWRSFEQVLCSSTGGSSQTNDIDEFGCYKVYDGVVRGASILDECKEGGHTCTSPHMMCLVWYYIIFINQSFSLDKLYQLYQLYQLITGI